MKLETVSFKETCPTIKYSFQLETYGAKRFDNTLIAKFSGKYREGSAGNPDARFMCGMLRTACDLWSPKSVIIDLGVFHFS